MSPPRKKSTTISPATGKSTMVTTGTASPRVATAMSAVALTTMPK